MLDITRFATSNGQVVAVGRLSGTATRSSGAIAHLLDNPPISNSVIKHLLTAVVQAVGALRLLT